MNYEQARAHAKAVAQEQSRKAAQRSADLRERITDQRYRLAALGIRPRPQNMRQAVTAQSMRALALTRGAGVEVSGFGFSPLSRFGCHPRGAR